MERCEELKLLGQCVRIPAREATREEVLSLEYSKVFAETSIGDMVIISKHILQNMVKYLSKK